MRAPATTTRSAALGADIGASKRFVLPRPVWSRATRECPRDGRTATRLDPASGVREDAGFVAAGDDEMFCVVYRPPSAPRRGVVICCSLLAEQLRLYRTEVRAARALAARGFAVVRFHYRGTGHSGGSARTITLDSMVGDARRAAAVLAERTGAPSTVFCGARWGACVAGLAAAGSAGAPLVLWEPVVDWDRYVREAFRAHKVRVMTTGEGAARTMTHAIEEMRATGYLDLLGFPIYLGLHESAGGRGLSEIAAAPARPVLIVQVSLRDTLKPDLAALSLSLEARSWRVETALVTREEGSWWLLGRNPESTDALIGCTASWLERLDA